MPEKMTPVVTINLDKERHFKLTMGTLLRFKQATGKDIRSKEVQLAMVSTDDIYQLEYTCAILWAGLAWEDKNLKQEDLADLIDLSRAEEISQKIIEAFELAAPEVGDKTGDPLAVK
jgi:hypothetical protein